LRALQMLNLVEHAMEKFMFIRSLHGIKCSSKTTTAL